MGELKGIIKFVGTVGNVRVDYNKSLRRFIALTKGTTPN
jgi:hypothetical protein